MTYQKGKIVENEFIFGLLVVVILLVLYYVVFAMGFVTKKYTLPGDTYLQWSLNYMSLYSLQRFNTLPWWDPTIYNGYPLYYHFLSCWSNYLSPYYLPSLLIFKIANILLGITINNYIIFHHTLYVISLNVIAIYLISRALIKNRVAAIFPPLVFSFSYFQLLNFHDFYALEAMIAPLFYLNALIRYNNKRTTNSLLLLFLFSSLYISSLDNGIVMSAIFWSSIFTILLIVFNPDIVKNTFSLVLRLVRLRRGKVVIALSIILLLSSFWSSWSSPHYNLGHVIKYRGGMVDYKSASGLTNSPRHIEKSEIWTILFNWFPFPEIHDILKFSWNGHDNRYIGLSTLPLLIAAFIFGLRNRYIYILLLTYFICNGYIIYTTDNIVYRLLTDNSDLFRNVRNMLTIFPRGGPILFLIFLAGIGLDRLIKISGKMNETNKEKILSAKFFFGELRLLTFIGFLLLVSIILITKSFVEYISLRHTLSHMGFYLIIFSVLCKALLLSNNTIVSRWILTSLFILTFTDLTISASYQIDRTGHGRINYQQAIPDDTIFRPINFEYENMFQHYGGVYHNPDPGEIGIMWGIKEWLVLSTQQDGLKFLTNWNAHTIRMTKYPAFEFFSNGYYLPFERINDIGIDKSIFEKWPLFYLHDEELVQSRKTVPEVISGTYEIHNYTFNDVTIRTKTDRDGFLYFLDNYDRFWGAYVDKKRVKIYRANFSFKAIELPHGEHKISWVYNPYPIKISYLVFYLMLGTFCIYYTRGVFR